MATLEERQRQPVTIPAELVAEIWSAVKDLRDHLLSATNYERELTELLHKMEDAGMTSHLPTIEEVQDAWKAAGGETEVKG